MSVYGKYKILKDLQLRKSKINILLNSIYITHDMSHCMGKPKICIGENKGADQLRSNREADQRLCFRYTNTISLFSKSKISSL